MEANFYISQETGLVMRSVQKMKAERPEEYELTLTGIMAKKLGLNLNTLISMYEQGVNHDKLESLIETANFFKSSIKAAGFLESKENINNKNVALAEYVQEELKAYRVEGKEIYVSEDVITDEVMEGYSDSTTYVLDVYVNGDLPIDFIYHNRLVDAEMLVSDIAKYFIADIKSKGFKVDRTVVSKESVEVQREWKIVNGKMEYIKVGQIINGKFFGEIEYYNYGNGIRFKHIINGKEFDVDAYNNNIKLLQKMASEIDDKQEKARVFGLIGRLKSFYKERAGDISSSDIIKLKNGVYIGVSECRFAIEDMIFSYFGFDTDVLLADEVVFGKSKIYAKTKDFSKFGPTEKALDFVDENGIGRDSFIVNIKS